MNTRLSDIVSGPEGDDITFAYFYELYPRKVARGAAQKAWDKLNPNAELKKEIKLSLLLQMRSRRQQEDFNSKLHESKQKHIPDWPHPATWLNGARWADELPSLQAFRERHTDYQSCSECDTQATQIVSGTAYCCYHWSRKFTPQAFVEMYEQLKRMGLGKLKSETRHDYAMRCKAHVQQMGYKGVADR